MRKQVSWKPTDNQHPTKSGKEAGQMSKVANLRYTVQCPVKMLPFLFILSMHDLHSPCVQQNDFHMHIKEKVLNNG